MNFVIPMAGRGQRFVDAGYLLPKMLIKVKGKTLLEWSVDSLPLQFCTNLVFILLKEHAIKFQLEERITEKYKHYHPKFVVLENVTRGQAETVFQSRDLWDLEKELLIYNIDTAFHSVNLGSKLSNNTSDGILGAFIDKTDSSKFSYAKLNAEDDVIEVVEKEKISEYALTGMYHFTNPTDFLRITENNIKNNETVKGEFYVAPIYNQLLKEGKNFQLDVCESIDILGTPEELKQFIAKI